MRSLVGAVLVGILAQLAACSSSDLDSESAGGANAAGGSAGTTSGGSLSVAGGGSSSGGAPASGGSLNGTAGLGGSSGTGSGGDSAGAGAGGTAGASGANGGGAGRSSGGRGGSSNGGSGNGGSGNGGSGNGGSAGSVGSECAVVPVTPNATAATRKVLCYLNSLYGNHILSAQEEDNSDDGMNTVHAATGKYPAIRAFDVNNSMAPTQCAQHWQQRGGLCMFGYHMGINGQTYDKATNINNVLTDGTDENKSFKANLDRFAQYIQPLQAAGGVAIVRLFHEAGKGCAWFWWSMGTSDQYKSLYKYAFNYLTATKGLTNVLWVVPLCGSPDPAYDPGKQYSDFGGADTYVTDTGPLTDLFKRTEAAFPGRPAMLHECGKIPDPAQLKSTSTKWLLFNLWSNPFFHADHNSADWLKQVYTSDYVITADELPSFK